MLGRFPGSTCAQRLTDRLGYHPPPRTPGSLGHQDAADPSLPARLGDSPGPLGHSDYAEERAHELAQWLAIRHAEPLKPPTPSPPPPIQELDTNKLLDQLRSRGVA